MAVRRVLAAILLLLVAVPVVTWVWIDSVTAVFMLAVSGVICICAALPVLFSVLIRRGTSTPLRHDDAEVIEITATDRRKSP